MSTHWVMDYETLSDCFLGVFEHYKKDEVKVFTAGLLRNDLPEFLDFLTENIKKNQWHISFNGLGFDSQITQYILVNREKLLKLNGQEAAALIYKKAQDCINRQTNKQWQEWSEKQLSIKQIDVFKLNHWDNPAKRSSLKWIQFSMDWPNVQDMPIDHTASITTVNQLQDVAKYCRNDVSSTKKIMEISTSQINLRADLTKQYKINLYNASEPKISKELFLYFLGKKTGVKPYELRQLRTYRSEIKVKDLILPYINFNDVDVFQELLHEFNKLTILPNQTKGGFKYSINYRGVKTDFGLGGVHGAKKGVYKATEGFTIMSSDVVSFYPNLAIRNGWSPAHLSIEDFLEQYEWFFTERKKIPKSDIRNYVYKIILNSTYGLSNDQNSFLYDPEFTMRITINGQLTLMLLYVMIAENIPGVMPIMQNTDGLETLIPTNQIENYLNICKHWEEITNLKLEHDEYQKLIVPDVNNYIGVFKYKKITKEKHAKLQKDIPDGLFKIEDGKYYHAPIKCKGRFEYKNLALHKNKSFLIIPKALYHYFIHDIKPEDFLIENRKIFDYCGGVKIKGDWKFMETCVIEGKVVKKQLQKTIRYYISRQGCKIVKENKSDGRCIQVVSKQWLQTVFNVYEDLPFREYGINDQFYLERIYKEIKALEPEKFETQTSLF
jgi:hypothetical protein